MDVMSQACHAGITLSAALVDNPVVLWQKLHPDFRLYRHGRAVDGQL